jgi:small G protein signaling modulator 3
MLSEDDRSLTSFPDPSTPSLQVTTPNEPLHRLLDVTGPSIFDDQTSHAAADPQSLSAAPPNVLQEVIDHQGAANLVRRLATLLAERDAHVTALTRLAEEYKVPSEKIRATASRVRQSEERRLALSTAADEDLAPSETSDTSVSYYALFKAQE